MGLCQKKIIEDETQDNLSSFLSLMFCLCYLRAYLGYGIFEMDLRNCTSNLSKVLTKYVLS